MSLNETPEIPTDARKPQINRTDQTFEVQRAEKCRKPPEMKLSWSLNAKQIFVLASVINNVAQLETNDD